MGRGVVVIGGGLTGLAAAWHLAAGPAGTASGRAPRVTLLEVSDRLGGEIHTMPLEHGPLDVGADAFLRRQPEGERLLREVGFDDADLAVPALSRVAVRVDGRLRDVPGGTVLGVPTDLGALARSGVLAPLALARAAAEPLVPRRRVVGDRTVADLVGERFGPAVVDRLVEPLLGGVYAGRADRLSAAATLPPVWEAARRHRTLLGGRRPDRRPAPGGQGPAFVTVRGGLGRLVDRLASALGDRITTGVAAVGLTRARGAWQVETSDGSLTADHVIVAVPAAAAAALLAGVHAEAARELAGIRTASVGVVVLAYDRAAARSVPKLSGVLVPRSEAGIVKAVTLTSAKWEHLGDRDRFLVRGSVGRVDDTVALDMPDDALADRVDAQIREMLGITAPAAERLVVRWVDALPQYDLGHLDRVDRIRAALDAGPRGLHLGGAALDGVGLSARARDGLGLARAALAP